ncbi:MAG: D-alanyl-D-alanine carboxypeptidase [Lachnospiraceae bacterium]|nr:D-alanyl-D-alanine carboxypeptidase [Lachnospiraceae bacterium]
MARITPFKVLILALISISVSGCSSGELERPYDFSSRVWESQQEESEPARAAAFAQDLCVVTDFSGDSDTSVTAEAAGVFSMDGSQTFYSKNVYEKLYPASTTKIMTALIAIKYGNLSDEVTVTSDAVITEAGATLSGIHPGDKLTLEQLLYGLMLPSGNDAGAAIAVHMGGSIEGFADMMNQEARAIGATGTHFTNPHGLHEEDHYTTAYDLYLIFHEALKYPKFREVTGSTAYAASYQSASGETISTTWKGGNWFMTGERETPEGLTVFGGKTGTTRAAGYCLVMGTRDVSSDEYISVIMKAESRPGLYDNMANIISKIVN